MLTKLIFIRFNETPAVFEAKALHTLKSRCKKSMCNVYDMEIYKKSLSYRYFTFVI